MIDAHAGGISVTLGYLKILTFDEIPVLVSDTPSSFISFSQFNIVIFLWFFTFTNLNKFFLNESTYYILDKILTDEVDNQKLNAKELSIHTQGIHVNSEFHGKR